MKLWINNEECSGQVPETQLGPLVDRLRQDHHLQGLHLSHVLLNGEEIGTALHNRRDLSLEEVERLDLEFVSLEALIERNLENAGLYLERLLPGIEKTAAMFRTGSEQEANQLLLNVVDGIEWFSEVVDSIIEAKNLQAADLSFQGKTVAALKNSLLDLTSKMLKANQNQDWVLLADLLEYEIHPFYENWKTILPELKRTRPNLIN
ncbi:MAG: hypothetical protein ACE5ER_10360 [Nitrospinaceae bacterium]